jgi:uncharacterized membrane protein YccF (DUF307 family)
MKGVQLGAVTNSSRLGVSTILGLFFGVICMLLTKYSVMVDFWPVGVSFLLHHTVMGLVIGVSSLKMHWSIHGLFWGALFGIFLAIGHIGTTPAVNVFIFVLIWGFLIETLTSKVFRRPQS